jgi:hypothetical protein
MEDAAAPVLWIEIHIHNLAIHTDLVSCCRELYAVIILQPVETSQRRWSTRPGEIWNVT